ncbi:MAG: hypothetical protein J7K87_00100 [Candidatus Aenigmarchaeota archaeon]|nr:hypothetical protein [Candidatus Aenigmarchaeota archaeon]
MVLREELKTRAVQEVFLVAKQKSLLKTISILLSVTSIGIFGRALFQYVPSVEPMIPIVIGMGFYKNWKYGVSSGILGFFFSNFIVWGLQGPWTIFQCLGAALAGITGEAFSKISKRRGYFFSSLIVGTIIYEVIVNMGSLVFFPWWVLTGFSYLLAAIPFGMIHIFSSIGFGSIVYAFREKLQDIWMEYKVFSVWRSNNSGSNSNSIFEYTTGAGKGKNKNIPLHRLWWKNNKGREGHQ